MEKYPRKNTYCLSQFDEVDLRALFNQSEIEIIEPNPDLDERRRRNGSDLPIAVVGMEWSRPDGNGFYFQVFMPVIDCDPDPESFALAQSIMDYLPAIDHLARDYSASTDDDTDEILCDVEVCLPKVTLHYVPSTFNSDWWFDIMPSPDGGWIFDGWGGANIPLPMELR